jgi:branched-chain amino acid transport system permease protein
MSAEFLTLATLAGINILLAWGVYVIYLTGQISLGQGAFMAIGAYVSGVLTVNFGLPLIAAMLLGGVAAAVFGVILGFPALRVHGVYLVMVTIGVGVSVRVFFQNFEYTGGSAGFPGPSGTTLPLVYAVVLLGLLFLWRLTRSRLGWALNAVREDEVAAAAMGLNVTYLKVFSFALGGFITAIAGALYAHFLLFIRPESFGFEQSVLIVLFMVLGGVQTFWGPVVGALVLTLLPELMRDLEAWRLFAYGALLVFMMAVRPQGIITRNLLTSLVRLARRVAPAVFRSRGDDALD